MNGFFCYNKKWCTVITRSHDRPKRKPNDEKTVSAARNRGLPVDSPRLSHVVGVARGGGPGDGVRGNQIFLGILTFPTSVGSVKLHSDF